MTQNANLPPSRTFEDLIVCEITPLLPLVEATSKLLEAYSAGIRRRILIGSGAVLLGVSVLLLPALRLLF